jgi:TP901 family phage tail tape measure protein
MANELLISVKIGSVLASSFNAAFGSARSTLERIGSVTEQLSSKQQRLGMIMAQALTRPGKSLGDLRRQYDQLGLTMDRLRLKQDQLTASMARGDALRNGRSEMRSQAMETIGTAAAIGAPVVKSVMVAADFQDKLRDTAITGEFSAAQEAKLGGAIRESAVQWNQTQSDIQRGIGVLVAGGIQDANALERYAPIMSKAATGTRASMDDLGSVALALKDNLQIGEDGFEGALNMLAYAGKRGQFEIRDMAKWLPSLSPSFQALGVTGKEAVAEIGAALQIARKGAGSNDEAANNFRNFLAKLTAPETLKDFEKAGIDLKKSMMNLREQGMTPMQSMLSIITDYMGKKSPAAAGEMQKALAIKDESERKAAVQRLAEAYKLGDLFQDMQAMNFIKPAIANMGEMKDIQDGAMGAADKGLLDEDYKKRMETATEQFKAFKIGLTDVGLTIGEVLLPPLIEFGQEIRPVVTAFGNWAKEHPGLIKGVIGLTAGLLAGKLGFIGLKYGLNLVLSPLTAMRTVALGASARWTMLRGLWQAGAFAPAIAGLRSVVSGLMTVGRYALLFGKGLAMTFLGPLKLLGQGALLLGRVLGGALLSGLRLAGQAVLWLGRAMLMNPIGLAVTAIGVAAFLVYKNWDKVKAATLAGYNWLVGLKTKFMSAGADLINGLVSGVTSKLTAARDAIVGMGSSIKGWFTSTLGIKSPSRVFMGFGDNIAQGAALGVNRSASLAGKAVSGMAKQAAGAWQMDLASSTQQSYQKLTPTQRGGGTAGMGGGGGMVIHFSPNIQLAAGTPEAVRSQLNEGVQMSLQELERLIDRVVERKARRSY